MLGRQCKEYIISIYHTGLPRIFEIQKSIIQAYPEYVKSRNLSYRITQNTWNPEIKMSGLDALDVDIVDLTVDDIRFPTSLGNLNPFAHGVGLFLCSTRKIFK